MKCVKNLLGETTQKLRDRPRRMVEGTSSNVRTETADDAVFAGSHAWDDFNPKQL